MPTLAQDVFWPGVAAVESLQGTVSHGVSPSVFTLVTYPQAAAPSEYGTLAFGDGTRAVALRDCKVVNIDGQATADGQVWVLRIADRRWRWQNGTISGEYNTLDPRGKLVPWTIRSPEELARLCLAAMGEPPTYKLVLPPGLKAADGADLDRYLALGENFPQSLVNTPVVWNNANPAAALAALVEQYQCRVIFQPALDRVLVAPLGKGRPLPPGPCEVIAPAVSAPVVPSRVGVIGAPIRVQARLLLEPVGREWDGSFRPVNDLTYKPAAGWLNTPPPSYAAVVATDRLSYLEAVALAEESVFRCYRVKFANVGGGAGGDSKPQGGFVAYSTKPPPPSRPPAGNLSASAAGSNSGGFSTLSNRASADGVPNFAPSPAQVAANVDAAAAANVPAIVLPWYGRLKRRQQIVLQPTKAEQVVPNPRSNVGQAGSVGLFTTAGVLPEFYTGYSRDQGAAVYGRVDKACLTQVVWAGLPFNTPLGEKVRVPFAIDPAEQVVTFAAPVWRRNDDSAAAYEFPFLVLETACLVTDPATGAFVRFEQSRPVLGGVGPPEWQSRDDVQISVIGTYAVTPPASSSRPADRHKLTGFRFADLQDATARADYYLAALAEKYKLTGGGTHQYVGILPLDPDGFIQQVTWAVGPGGPATVASGNSEHSAYVLPYPARRRAENLPPNAAAAAANLADRQAVQALKPRPPGSPRA